MSPFSYARLAVPAVLALATTGLCQAPAQASHAGEYGTIFFKTNVGSFKFLGVAGLPAEGRVEISFTGTLLVDQLSANDPKITFSGNIRKEYDDPKHLQQAFHGTGSMVIDGKFTAIQWFGRDMSAKWNGFGIARLVGEFDKNLKTGSYWYGENPADVKDWGTNLLAITNPGKPGVDYQIVPQKRGG